MRDSAHPPVQVRGDYDPLLEFIGDARFVLLGEASHGTHEFYRECAQITKRLIPEKGFTAIAVEADWPDAYRVNRYARGESADPAWSGPPESRLRLFLPECREMLNEEIARIFERMARVLAFKGQDRFRIMAYERAAISIRGLKEDLAAIAEKGTLQEVPGIGKDLPEMIEEYIAMQAMKRYTRECKGIPEERIDLMSIPGRRRWPCFTRRSASPALKIEEVPGASRF